MHLRVHRRALDLVANSLHRAPTAAIRHFLPTRHPPD